MDKKNEISKKSSLADEGKTLLLVRHAKSSWDDFTLSDFDRPLNERGKSDAPLMARRLLERKVIIDAFISSPAKRAKKTAKAFMKEYDKSDKEIILMKDLYEAAIPNFEEVIIDINDEFESAAVFSHNPGITAFANTLTSHKLENMPTCSVFAVKALVKKWSDFKGAKKDFLFFDFPKNSAE